MSISLLVIDDHHFVREMICKRLESEQEFSIDGQADNGLDAVRLAEILLPDICLMDLELPGIDGIEATRRIVSSNKGIKVLAFTATSTPDVIAKLKQAGAAGCAHKTCNSNDLVSAIKHVYQGHTYFSAEPVKVTPPRQSNVEIEAGSVLSYRERQIVVLVCSGKTSRQIADQIGLSIRTVEVHRYRIMKRLNIKSVSELTKYAIKESLVS